MPIKRTYAEHGDACATAHAMEVLGDRWTYPVLRELMLAPKRFGELADGVLGVTPAVLTTRLRELEAAGLVTRRTMPTPVGVAVYELTAWAKDLEPTFQALGRWAQGSSTLTRGGGLTPDAVIQSLRTMAPPRALRPRVDVQVRLWDSRVAGGPHYAYRLSWGSRGLHVDRGMHRAATASIEGDSSAFGDVLLRARPLHTSGLSVSGDQASVRRLLHAFRDET